MGQISLAWMLCKKPYIVAIPGSRKPERLRENFEAGHIILAPEEISMIDSKLETMQFEVFGGHSAKWNKRFAGKRKFLWSRLTLQYAGYARFHGEVLGKWFLSCCISKWLTKVLEYNMIVVDKVP